ncbi:MAG: hypothetical protein A2099_07995 [Planctomycetes bacterium GWF2_39_10]|nr:MAG: hypothetical protein A2099_07995 [Planctomycetes bacterium GWF2_39_10]
MKQVLFCVGVILITTKAYAVSNRDFNNTFNDMVSMVAQLNTCSYGYLSCVGQTCSDKLPFGLRIQGCPSAGLVTLDVSYHVGETKYYFIVTCGNAYSNGLARDAFIYADNVLISRHYVSPSQYANNFSVDPVFSYLGSLPDVNNLPYDLPPADEFPGNSMLVNVETCGGVENGYKAVWVDLCDGRVFYTAKGICDNGVYGCYNSPDFSSCFSPTPTLTPEPSPTPTPTESPTPTGTSTPILTPTPFPLPTDPPPISQVGTITGTLDLNNGNINVTVKMPDQEQLSPYFKSGQAEENKINEIDDEVVSDEVPDVGQTTELEYTWLDDLLGVLSNHTILSVINGSHIVSSGELCEISYVIWGKTITFSFCDWEYWFDYLGYFVFAFSLYYAVVIVFLKGS